ncbi:hypothetical protein D934_01015 [Xylella fastidiosa subsp. sandyi Ann-1]|uniref:Uncharacterized protein n=1 Tax=Xylella fastidiosa subsp. sandyi Ann-1 TaxID=155920 RepID=A0A060HDH2_XYLFS|nr:hypothetical protein D934_01015 [Xylella fastidiosa subsp. sandyi Ann-1]
MWSNVRKSDSIFHGNIYSDSNQSKCIEVTGLLFEQQLMLQLAQDQISIQQQSDCAAAHAVLS